MCHRRSNRAVTTVDIIQAKAAAKPKPHLPKSPLWRPPNGLYVLHELRLSGIVKGVLQLVLGHQAITIGINCIE